MLKKYISKFTIDIMPSIIATIVGAYIVNHYIVPKGSAEAPAAATASTGDVKAAAHAKVMKASIKPAETTADVASEPDAALSADKPSAEKNTDTKTDTSSNAARRHQPAPREKAVAEKPVAKPVPVAIVAPVVPAPAATASITPDVEAVPTPSPVAPTSVDANDLARAAIERLRNSNEAPRVDAPRVQEAVRIPEAPRAAPAPVIQQLPPPIMVSTPKVETYGMPSPTTMPSYSDASRVADPRRPRPPGDIPLAPPLDLQADATGSTRQHATTVADDMLSAAKSVFHSVIPAQFDR